MNYIIRTLSVASYSETFLNIKGLGGSFLSWLAGIRTYLDMIPMNVYIIIFVACIALQIVKKAVSKVFTVVGIIIFLYMIWRYVGGLPILQ